MSFNGTMCTSMIKSTTAMDTKNYWVMGLPVYKSFDIVHDLKHDRMGFSSWNNSGIQPIFPPALQKALKQTVSIVAIATGLLLMS